jgi:hypothetical protein
MVKGMNRRSPIDSSSEEDENSPFVKTASLANSAEEQKNLHIIDAVLSLGRAITIIAIFLMIGLLLIGIDVIMESAIPAYIIFLVSLLGFLCAYVSLYFTISHLSGGLCVTEDENWINSNEHRIPLALFVFQFVSWVGGFLLCFLIAQTLYFFQYYYLIPSYCVFIPLYVFLGSCMLSILTCRSTHMLSSVSWICVSIGVILVNMAVLGYNEVDWFDYLLPFMILIGIWVVTILYVFVNFVCNKFALKVILYSFHRLLKYLNFFPFQFAIDRSSRNVMSLLFGDLYVCFWYCFTCIIFK